MQRRSAAPLGTIQSQSLAALQRNELPEVPSHNPTKIQHKESRVSPVSREVDNASSSLTAVNEADQTSNVDPSQRKANGIQQTRTPLTPPLNSAALTYLDKCFPELQTHHQAFRGSHISNALQLSHESVIVSDPAAAGRETSRKDMVEGASIAQESFPVQVNREVILELNERPPEPESQWDRSHAKSTAKAAEGLRQAHKHVGHQMLQGNASVTRRDDLPDPSPLTIHVTDVQKSHQTAASTRFERPELLSSDTYVVVEEEPPEEKQKTWEEETKRELDGFLRILTKGIRKSMLATRLCMAYTKGDEKRVAKPVIIISCNTKKCSKRVHKHLSGKPTLRCLEIFRVSVTVETVKEAALSDEDAPVLTPGSLPLISIGVEIKHKSDLLTYCGRNLRIEVWQDGVGKPSFATFGGVISVKGRFYGITTAHSFFLDPNHILGWDHSNDEDEGVGSTFAIATSPSTSVDSESITDSELSSIADAVQTTGRDGIEFESLAYLQPLSSMAYSYQGRTMKPGGTPMRDHSISDWVLFPLQPSVTLPNTYETHSLASVAPEFQLTAGPVSILLGIDASCEGYLTSPTASLHTEHAFMNVREIMLKSALPKGASGAWVVRGAEVCGYVVALIGEGLSCFMIPMERTFREISELFGNDVEFGPKLHDRIRGNRQVDALPESLIAAAQRASEALEEFGQNIELHSGANPDSIIALREPKHKDLTSGPSHKAGLGTDPVDAVDPAIRPLKASLGIDSNEKTEPVLNAMAKDAGIMAEDCGRESNAFLELAKRFRSRGMESLNIALPRSLFYSGEFQYLFITIAQDLNMMHLTWSRIRDWLLITTGHTPPYLDAFERSLYITHYVFSFLTSFRHLFPKEKPSVAHAIRQAINAVSSKRKLNEIRRIINRLVEDTKYLQDQFRVPAGQTIA